MAQVKFYSVAADATRSDANGIYFVTGGELYKGTSRFGANKVFTKGENQDLASFASVGQIGGDILVGIGAAKVWDPATGANGSWVDLGQDQVALDNQLKALVSGLSFASGTGSYITGITQDSETGNVTAAVSNFANDVKAAIGNSSVSGAGNGITVSVATTSGIVTSVQVSASALTVDTITAATGNFTNLNVSNTASFVATTVSADSLTIGGKSVEQIAGEQIAASTLSGNITASGGTALVNEGQVVTYVSAAVSSFDNAMHYIGTTSDPAIVQDATAVPSDISGYTSAKRKSGDIVLKGTEEYIWNGSKWEKIGDQSAVTGGTSTSTLNNVQVQVVTAAATAAPTVTLTGVGTAASMNYTSEIAAAGSSLPTESAVAAYVKTFADAADAKASTGASYSTYGGLSAAIELSSNAEPTITLDGTNVVTASTGVVTASANLVTAGAVADYVDGKIGALDASVTSSENTGIVVSVKQVDGAVTQVQADLLWLDANGNALA